MIQGALLVVGVIFVAQGISTDVAWVTLVGAALLGIYRANDELDR